MLGGALALALGLDLLHAPTQAPGQTLWSLIGLAAGGWAALTLGVVLGLRQSPKKAASATRLAQAGAVIPAPLGAATLVFRGNAPPEIVSRDSDLQVIVEDDGTVRFKLKGAGAADRLICRADSAAYFNTLRQERQEAAIKLIGPMPARVRLELWDRAQITGTSLKKRA
jgi:hypothetical protein